MVAVCEIFLNAVSRENVLITRSAPLIMFNNVPSERAASFTLREKRSLL